MLKVDMCAMRALVVLLAAVMLMVAGCPGAEPAAECPSEGPRVCGTDGNTYANECFAQKAGVGIAHEGECTGDEAPGGPDGAQPSAECSDTDFGKNALEAGTATKNGESHSDECVGSTHVMEYYCSANEIMGDAVECPAGTECYEGACVGEICVDSDGGVDAHSPGTVSKGSESYTDSCEDGSTVREYYCEGNRPLYTSVTCISGEACQEGVCVESDCSDTDGGQDMFEKGTVRADSVVYIDSCASGGTVKEYYCSGGEAKYAILPCPTDYYCINSKCSEYVCSDTDGGEDEDRYGEVRKGGNEYEDYCYDDDTVYEYYCSGDEVSGRKINCGSGEECEGGECVDVEEEEQYCTDSDGGHDVYERGTAEDNEGENTDYCIDGNRLREYYCSGDEIASEAVYCDRGEMCEGGECVPYQYCDDSDGGQDLYEPGTVSTETGDFDDYCIGSHSIREYYCDHKNLAYIEVECPVDAHWCMEEGYCGHLILT